MLTLKQQGNNFSKSILQLSLINNDLQANHLSNLQQNEFKQILANIENGKETNFVVKNNLLYKQEEDGQWGHNLSKSKVQYTRI